MALRSFLLRTAKRAIHRPEHPNGKRSFDAATGGRRASGFGTSGPVNPEIGAARETVQRRARYLAQNNPWIANAVSNYVGQLVGAGLMPNAAGDLTLDRAFLDWADTADADGRTDFAGLQAEVARAMIVDGEILVQQVVRNGRLVLRLIPAEQLDASYTRDLGGGRYAVQGVEFDASGQRVAYHILPTNPTAVFASYAPPVRVPASEILHVFKPIGTGQVRGISWLAPIILTAGEFDQLTDALLVGAKVSALVSAFIVDPNATGTVQLGNEPDLSEVSLEPGVVRTLPAGTDVRFSAPQQAKDAGPFLKTQLRALAAGLGIPTHFLDGDLSDSNYSSLRAGLIPFRARVEQIQKHILAPQFLAPTWRRALEIESLSRPDLSTDDLRVQWIPPRPM